MEAFASLAARPVPVYISITSFRRVREATLSATLAQTMNRILKVVGYTVAAIPILVIGQCMYNEVSQRSGLESLCGTAKAGSAIKRFLDDAAKTTYKLRTGGPTGKNDTEWFDREYLRLGEYLKRAKKLSEDYTVVFAKPGIGYYACIIVHKDGLVQSAWFEDRSS